MWTGPKIKENPSTLYLQKLKIIKINRYGILNELNWFKKYIKNKDKLNLTTIQRRFDSVIFQGI